MCQIRKYARTGIQTLSGRIPTTGVYPHRLAKVEATCGSLHGAGAIGPSGRWRNQCSAFGLLRFELPANKDETGASKTSLRVLDNGPDRITFPIVAADYMGAVKSADFGLWLAGPTGC